jgi:hypothetical protein
MAWEWIPPVAGAVVGLAGILAGQLSSRASRNHDEEMARLRYQQERTSAKEDLENKALTDAYLDLLVIVERVGRWVDLLPRTDEKNRPDQVDPFPELEEQARARAKLVAFGSKEVMKLWNVYVNLVHEIRKLAKDIDQYHSGLDSEIRRKENEARTKIYEQIANELGGKRPVAATLPWAIPQGYSPISSFGTHPYDVFSYGARHSEEQS